MKPINKNIKLQTDVEYQAKSRLSPSPASNGQTPNFHCHSQHRQDDNTDSVHDSITQFISTELRILRSTNFGISQTVNYCSSEQ